MYRSGNFIEYVLEREDVNSVWHDYTHHDFVERMGNGTLPVESYKNYMIQDYLYLVRRAQKLAIQETDLSLDPVCSCQRIGRVQVKESR